LGVEQVKKKITITGLSGKTGTISVGLMNSVLTSEIIAGGTVEISGDSATITLKNPDDTLWTGSGSFYLFWI
jgi:hypothetical protein